MKIIVGHCLLLFLTPGCDLLWSAARSTQVNADLARKGCVKVYIWLARKNKLKKLVCVFFWDETLHVSSATLQHLLTRVSWVSQLENR